MHNCVRISRHAKFTCCHVLPTADGNVLEFEGIFAVVLQKESLVWEGILHDLGVVEQLHSLARQAEGKPPSHG